MGELKMVYKKIEEVLPYENNPRDNDEAVDAVAESIREFGFKIPIVISGDNVVVAGHTRIKAAKKLGMKEVPCIIADDLNEEQIGRSVWQTINLPRLLRGMRKSWNRSWLRS